MRKLLIVYVLLNVFLSLQNLAVAQNAGDCEWVRADGNGDNRCYQVCMDENGKWSIVHWENPMFESQLPGVTIYPMYWENGTETTAFSYEQFNNVSLSFTNWLANLELEKRADDDTDGIANEEDNDWPGPKFYSLQELLYWLNQKKGNLVTISREQIKFVFFPDPEQTATAIVDDDLFKGRVTIGLLNTALDLTTNNKGGINGVNFNFAFGFDHTFFSLGIEYAGGNNTAIEITTQNFEHIEAVLKMLGNELTDNQKVKIIDIYKQAVTVFAGDPNKLDVIYESAPKFVLKGLDIKINGQPVRVEGISDDKKLADLKTISEGTMTGSVGTDEERAALNILEGVNDNKKLYGHLYANPELVKNLYSGIDGKEAWELVDLLKELGNKYWPENATLPSSSNSQNFVYLGNADNCYIKAPVTEAKYTLAWNWSPPMNLLIDIHRFIQGITEFGQAGVSSPYNQQLEPLNPLDPVRVYISEDDKKGVVVPAIYIARIEDAETAANLWALATNVTKLLGISSAVRLIFAEGTVLLLRVVGLIELSKVAIDDALDIPAVKLAIASDDELKEFFKAGGTWQKISIATDIATFTLDMLSSLVKNGTKAKVILNANNETEAASKLDEIVLEAGDALSKKIGKTIGSTISWKPNRVISGNLDNPKGMIGTYEKTLPNGEIVSDTKKVIEELQFDVSTRDNFINNNKEGFKLLNTPNDNSVSSEQFWEEFNKPWLDDLTSKKADVVVLSDKDNDFLKYVLNPDNTFKIDPNSGQKILTGFGKEIEYMDALVQQGIYQWNTVEGVYKFIF